MLPIEETSWLIERLWNCTKLKRAEAISLFTRVFISPTKGGSFQPCRSGQPNLNIAFQFSPFAYKDVSIFGLYFNFRIYCFSHHSWDRILFMSRILRSMTAYVVVGRPFGDSLLTTRPSSEVNSTIKKLGFFV